MKNILLGMGILLGSVSLLANTVVDTADFQQLDSLWMGDLGIDALPSNFDANMDSTLQLYQVREALNGVVLDDDIPVGCIPDFPDSVYIARMAAIPTTIKLTYNPIVKSFIDVYAKKRRKNMEVILGLSEHYFPIFDDIFDYYDVPNEMKYMSIIESALNPRAYSRARAVGLWQFMFGTGRMCGLEINSLVDERRDPIKSTYAAALYSKKLYAIYGDWLLVIAAYNCGPGNVNRAIRRAGGKKNYWDIYPFLPRETRNHVPAFIAVTYLMNYYSEHNLKAAPVELPLVTDTLHIKKQLHLMQVAEVLNISIEQLRDLNPQYRSDIIPAGSKQYSLSLPNDLALRFIDLEDSIYHYKDSVFFDPKQQTISPRSYTDHFIPEAPGKDFVKLTYVVKSGDNLGFISEWYDVSITDIRYWNNINRNMIRSGQKLAIYKPKSKAAKYEAINTMTFAQKQSRLGKTTTNSATTVTASATFDGEYEMYTVRSGDTLWEIARKFPGVTDTDIMRLNNMDNANKITPGQRIKIKPKS